MDFEETVKFTSEWYKTYYENPTEIQSFTKNQILKYIDLANKKQLQWAK